MHRQYDFAFFKKSSDRSTGNYQRPTDIPTDRPTIDGHQDSQGSFASNKCPRERQTLSEIYGQHTDQRKSTLHIIHIMKEQNNLFFRRRRLSYMASQAGRLGPLPTLNFTDSAELDMIQAAPDLGSLLIFDYYPAAVGFGMRCISMCVIFPHSFCRSMQVLHQCMA